MISCAFLMPRVFKYRKFWRWVLKVSLKVSSFETMPDFLVGVGIVEVLDTAGTAAAKTVTAPYLKVDSDFEKVVPPQRTPIIMVSGKRSKTRPAKTALVADDVVDCGAAVINFGFGRYCQVDRRVAKTAISSSTEFTGAVTDNRPVPTQHLAAMSPIGRRFRDSADSCF